MIDYSLIKIVPAEESHREFSYNVKKEAYGKLITATYGWDEQEQRNFHAMDWQQRRASIIVYHEKPIGTIYINRSAGYLEIGGFFILTRYQNQGIGSYILKNLLTDTDKTGQLSKLAVIKTNPAISLYRRYGFEIIKDEKELYQMERKPKAVSVDHRKYKAVIFDLFGTLVNIFSRAEYEKTLAEMTSILKVPYEEFEKVWYQTAGKRTTGEFRNLEDNIEYICRELKITVSEKQVKRACEARMNFVARALEPKEDAITTLKILKARGYKIGLISNCSTEPPVIWPETLFAPYFDAAIFSSICGLQKPDPRIYMLATEKLVVKPEDCCYIGDGDGNELTGAAQVGMHPILIRDINEIKQNVMRSGYQGDSWDGAVINSLSALLNLL